MACPTALMIRSRLRSIDATAILVATVSVGVQLVFLAEGRNDPTFETPVIDAGVYHDAAVRFSQGEPLGDDAFWQPPLFPLLLGCLYRLVGPQILIAKGVLAIVATSSCVILWWIGRRLFSRRVGLVAGLVSAVYGPFVFFSTRLLPTNLGVFLDLLALALWLSCLEQPRWHRWLAFGVTVGLATITIPNAAVLLVLALTGSIISWLRNRHRRTLFVSCSMMIVGAALPIGSVTVRNNLVSGEWVLISTNGGINFYLGNNPHSDRTLAIRPGEHWRRFARQSYAAGAQTRAEQSVYFFRRSAAYIADQPTAFLRGLCRKSIRLINAREIPRNVDPYVYHDFSHLLSILMWRAGPFAFPFGLMAPFAAWGLFIALRSTDHNARRRSGRVALGAFVVTYGASVALFFVSSRYRLPMVMPMIVFAAAGAVRLWDRVAQATFFRSDGAGQEPEYATRDRHRWAPAAVFLVAVILVNTRIRVPTDGVNFRAELDVCVGQAYATLGKLDDAERYLRQALQREPHNTTAVAGLAGVLIHRDELEAARQLLQRAVSWDEQAPETRLVLANLLRRQGRLDEAASAFENVLAIDPTSPDAHAGLADLFMAGDRVDDAIDHYRLALQFTEDPGPIHVRLADALVQTGAYAEAIERYRRGLWHIDADPATLNRIAWLLATCPQVELRDCRRAIEIAEHVCRITDYRHAVALDTLAAAYAECNQWASAVTWARLAIDVALAENDSTMARSFRPRLKLYEERLSGRSRR